MRKKKSSHLVLDGTPSRTTSGAARCPACGNELGRGLSPEGKHRFCPSCKKELKAALNGKRAIAYCRTCNRFQPLDARKHAQYAVPEKLTIILFEAEGGCHQCYTDDLSEHPHSIVVRVPYNPPASDAVA